MLSFRVEDRDASEATRWADMLGIDRSELLRDALRRHLVLLRAENEVDAWTSEPLTAGELALASIADWGPSEEWADWADAKG